jgi:hypothetical protein
VGLELAWLELAEELEGMRIEGNGGDPWYLYAISCHSSN